jgi:hypothetical protein
MSAILMRHGALACVLVLGGCRSCALHPPLPPIVCDGELDEPSWKQAVRTGPFLDENGMSAAPYSDARFVVGPDALYLGLYAADEDIQSSDTFVVDIGGRELRFHPTDHGADVGVDMDGSLDVPSDDDEEWVVEARVPLAGLGHGDVMARVRRCDRVKDGRERCGSGQVLLRLP